MKIPPIFLQRTRARPPRQLSGRKFEKCAITARQSEASFRAITFSDAWYFGAALQALLNKKDGAIRLLQAATEHNLCVYPSVDSDPLFDKIRASAEFKAVRQAGIDFQKRFAPYAEIEIQ